MKSKSAPGPPLTVGSMRQLGVRGLIVSCPNPQCRHDTIFSADDYADKIEVPSFVPRMVCGKCGGKRVDVRPNWKEMPVMPPKLRYD